MLLSFLLACPQDVCKTGGFRDLDGDGYGDTPTELWCGPDAVSVAGDCDDADPKVFPGASEGCDGRDEDCDGAVDDDPVDGSDRYADADGDGWGDDADVVPGCGEMEARVPVGGDCDDADPAVHPEAEETCDTVDEDCDGEVDDEATDAPASWTDADADGYGGGDPEWICVPDAGSAAQGGDCDDADADSFPGAEESCDGADEDCDGTVDEDAVDRTTWHADLDADGYGDPATSTETCAAADGWVFDGSDCDDTDAGVHPGADELCDGVDQDCDYMYDEAAVDRESWYRDGDEDGYGYGSARLYCSDPSTSGSVYVTNDADCDDRDDDVYPGAADAAGDGDDADCDGVYTCYEDGDGDDFGSTSVVISGDADCYDAGEATNTRDCDDADADVNPSESELAYDAVDQDCDGLDLVDVDGDGWDAAEVGGPDCDDADPTLNPDGTERCDTDEVDEDCDGLVNDADPDLTGSSVWYADRDGDGWGDESAASVGACGPADGVVDAGDCDDADAEVYPFALEDCTSGVDANCDGSVGATDSDGDGLTACEDCDDGDAATGSGVPEVALNRRDDDCDGLVDENIGAMVIELESEAVGFCAKYASVEGDLDLIGLPSLEDLACLRAVSGDLRIAEVSASDLDGLDLLTAVGGDLLLGGWQEESRVLLPSAFTSLDGLGRLRSVGGDFWIAQSDVADVSALGRLDSVGESLVIWDLPVAEVNLTLTTLGDDLWLEDLPNLDAVSAPALVLHGGSLWLETLALTSGDFTLDWPVEIGGALALVDLPDGVAMGWSLPDRVGALIVSETEMTSLDGLGDIRVVVDDASVADNDDLTDVSGLDGLEEVGGGMTISHGGRGWDGFPNLTRVGGWLRLYGSSATTLTGFPALEAVGEGLEISGNSVTSVTGFGTLASCPSLELTSLRAVTDLSGLVAVPFSQDVTVYDLRSQADLSFLSGVAALTGNLSVTSCSGLGSLTGIEGLQSVGGAVTVQGDNGLTEAPLGGLRSIGGALTLRDLRRLTSLDLGALETVGGDVAIEELDVLPDLAGLGSLREVGGLWVSQLDGVTDLRGLERLVLVEGNLIVEYMAGLLRLDGLEGLEAVGQDLQVVGNGAIEDLDGLDALGSVGRDVTIEDNPSLVRPGSLGALASIGRDLWIEDNDALEDLDGLGTFAIGNKLWLSRNPALVSLVGLEGLSRVPSDLVLADLDALADLRGLGGLTSVGGVLRVGSCPMLVDLVGLDELTEVGGSVEIGDQRSWGGWGGGNTGLTSLDGLGALLSVGDDLWIQDDAVLVDISALGNVRSVGGDLGILDNPSLLTADAEALSDGTPTVAGTVYISGNL